MKYKIFLINIWSIAVCTMATAQIQTGIWRTAPTNTEYHQFTRNGSGSAVYINQQDGVQPILRLSSGTLSPNVNVRVTVENDGSVGIGTLTPRTKLDVNGSISSSEKIIAFNPSNPEAAFFMGWQNNISRIRIGGNGTGSTNGMDIQTTSDNSLMRLLNNGNIGIGTTTPTHRLHVAGSGKWTGHSSSFTEINSSTNGQYIRQYANNGITQSWIIRGYTINGVQAEFGEGGINVNGTIKAKEVNITASGWADHVFDPEYGLMDLGTLKAFVKKNRHLPGIPTEKEVAEKGIDLAKINVKLLEKIEELTLYVIQQEEKIKEQESKIKSLTDQSAQFTNEMEEVKFLLKTIGDGK